MDAIYRLLVKTEDERDELSAKVTDLEFENAALSARVEEYKKASSALLLAIGNYQQAEELAETPDEYAEVFMLWDELQNAAGELEALKGETTND